MDRYYELVEVDPEGMTEGRMVGTLAGGASVTYYSGGLGYEVSAVVYEQLDPSLYYRLYMVCQQGAETERVALATFVPQLPKRTMSAASERREVRGYSPLIELDSDYPPLGWTASGDAVASAVDIVRNHCRAPVSRPSKSAGMAPWTASDNDTWLDCLVEILAAAGMHVEVTGSGTVTFADNPTGNESPVFVFDDAAYDLPSIIMPEVTDNTSYYDSSNTVEVIYSKDGAAFFSRQQDAGRVKRDGYVRTKRDTSPKITAPPTQAKVEAYAKALLADELSIENEANFTHAYVPTVRPNRCVELDYTRHGYRVCGQMGDQTLQCTPAALVSSVIKYTGE